MSAPIRLIVGLGNPGAEYEQTRHNAGAWLVSRLARAENISLSPDRKFFGLAGRGRIGGEDCWLLLPTTFMNLSGQAVAALANFYKIKPEEILVVHDELDRKSTRLNSSHVRISYAVFCLKKKKKK